MSSSDMLSNAARDTPARRPVATLLSIMLPFSGLVLILSGVAVAVPVIRESFTLNADTASWIITSYTVTYIGFQPLFGRLGDVVGYKSIYLLGIACLIVGTALGIASRDMTMLLAARALQGMGGASVNPLSMSIILETFPRERHGRTLATWNVVGPVTGTVGPLLAGFLLERFHWSTIFVVPIIVSTASIVLLIRYLPKTKHDRTTLGNVARLDWWGFALLIGFVTFFVSYVSSRPITGIAPLHDLRLGGAAALFLIAFIIRERRVPEPFVPIRLLRIAHFTGASLCAASRMFMLSGINFLVPLYVTDVHGFSAGTTGLIVTTNAFALMITMRLGGRLIDRTVRSLPVTIGLLLQGCFFMFLALLPDPGSVWPVFALVGGHGLAAGVSLAPLHKFALGETPNGEVGMAAGLYSLIRFIGVLVGAALGGVLLQAGLDSGIATIFAYRHTFLAFAAVGVTGAVLARTLLRTTKG